FPRGSEHGASGPDNDLRLAGCDAPPMPTALHVAQVAVQDRHVFAPAAKPLDRLRRQTDFRYEYQRLFPLLNNLFDCFEINLGLAASCDTVEQKSVKPACPDRWHDSLPNLLL